MRLLLRLGPPIGPVRSSGGGEFRTRSGRDDGGSRAESARTGDAAPLTGAAPRRHSAGHPGGQELLALFGSLAALALSPPEELGQLFVPFAFRVLDVGLEAEGVAQARFGEPDDVV